MRLLPTLLVVSLVGSTGPAALAAIRLALPFASHMVVQRDKPLSLLGTAEADAIAVGHIDSHLKHPT